MMAQELEERREQKEISEGKLTLYLALVVVAYVIVDIFLLLIIGLVKFLFFFLSCMCKIQG